MDRRPVRLSFFIFSLSESKTPFISAENYHSQEPDSHLVEVDSLVESFLAVGGKVDETLPLLVDLIDPLLDLLSTEIASLYQVLAGLDDRLQVRMSRLHLVFHGLKWKTIAGWC